MDGLNKKFMSDPVTFIRNRMIKHDSGIYCPHNTTYEFDFHEKAPYVVLQRFEYRPSKTPNRYSKRIPAVWLKWKENHSFTVTLDGPEKYFFTATLSGCRLRISGDSKTPIVSHIAYGPTAGTKPAAARMFREKQTAKLEKQELAAGQDKTLVRTLSSTAFEKAALDQGADIKHINVFGLKNATGDWEFFCQSVAYDKHTQSDYIHRVWELYRGEEELN